MLQAVPQIGKNPVGHPSAHAAGVDDLAIICAVA
jgi:hypothetical protein